MSGRKLPGFPVLMPDKDPFVVFPGADNDVGEVRKSNGFGREKFYDGGNGHEKCKDSGK